MLRLLLFSLVFPIIPVAIYAWIIQDPRCVLIRLPCPYKIFTPNAFFHSVDFTIMLLERVFQKSIQPLNRLCLANSSFSTISTDYSNGYLQFIGALLSELLFLDGRTMKEFILSSH